MMYKSFSKCIYIMPKKSNKRSNKRKTTRKQRLIVMVGCSRKHKHTKSCKKSKDLGCPKCGSNCRCGPKCNCSHSCSGNCYLNRRIKKQKGGSGCGSCGCPIGGLSYKAMNKFGGSSYPNILEETVMPKSSIILGTGHRGGSCGQMPVVSQGGGNFYKSIGAMPGPFTGSSWEANKLPGDDGISSNRNFLKSYAGDIANDPALKMSMNDSGYNTMNSKVGGYRYNKKNDTSSVIRGGGLVPQDLVNLGRDFTYNFKSAYNALNGFPAPVNPIPYKDQLSGTINNNRLML